MEVTIRKYNDFIPAPDKTIEELIAVHGEDNVYVDGKSCRDMHERDLAALKKKSAAEHKPEPEPEPEERHAPHHAKGRK